jgi:hypothetical protein
MSICIGISLDFDLTGETQTNESHVNEIGIESNQLSNKRLETSVFNGDAKAMYNSEIEITIPLPDPYEVQVYIHIYICIHIYIQTKTHIRVHIHI